MKKYTLLLIGLGFIFLGACNNKGNKEQTGVGETGEVRKLFTNFMGATLREDYDEVYELTYPETLKGMSKERVINEIKDGLHNKDYDVRINELRIDSVYKTIEFKSNTYSMVQSTTKATFLMHYPGDKDPERLSFLFNKGCERMKEEIGEENVECNSESLSIDVRRQAKNYAIYDSKKGKWFIVGDLSPSLLKRFVPAEVRREFGEE